MNELTMRSRKKSKDTLKQMKKRTQSPKSVGPWESNPNRESHNITGLSQKTRKSLNRQSNLTLKGT